MQTILIVVHLFIAIGLIGLVLIQHGKGADAGAAFGSGASATVFGAAGSGNFLSRATAVLAATFFITSLGMAWYSMQTPDKKSLMEGATTNTVVETKAETAVAPKEPSEAPVVIPDAGEQVEEKGGDLPTIPK
jgi:preprotein translocase subunit SecG